MNLAGYQRAGMADATPTDATPGMFDFSGWSAVDWLIAGAAAFLGWQLFHAVSGPNIYTPQGRSKTQYY